MLGLVLSSFYWLPSIVLLDSVSSGVLFDPYFEAWRWLFGFSASPPAERIVFLVFLCCLTALPILGAAFIYARGAVFLWILLPVAFVVVMNLSLSEPIWRNWIIAKVQFPWRLMAFADLATAVAAATLAARVTRPRGGMVLAVVLVLAATPFVIISSSITYTQPTNSAVVGGVVRDGAAEYLSPEAAEMVQARFGKDEFTHFDRRLIAEAFDEAAAEFQATEASAPVLDRRPRSLTVFSHPDRPEISVPVQYWFL